MSYVESLKSKTVEELLFSLGEARSYMWDFIRDKWDDDEEGVPTSDQYILDNMAQTIHKIQEEIKSRGVTLAEDQD